MVFIKTMVLPGKWNRNPGPSPVSRFADTDGYGPARTATVCSRRPLIRLDPWIRFVCGSFWVHFGVVQRWSQVHLKQKIARNLNFTGVKSQLPQNLTKASENDVHDRKIRTKNFFRRRKMKCWGSSETRFGKVWGRLELCLGVNSRSKFWKFSFWDKFILR